MLVAIAIPVFTTQLEKSREATDQANIRAAYAELMTSYLEWDGTTAIPALQVPVKQAQANWQCNSNNANITIAEGISGQGITVAAKTSGNYTVSINTSTGAVTVS